MSYDDWSKLDELEEDELEDTFYLEQKRDVVLFAIDCSESMQALHDDPKEDGKQTSHLFTALVAAMHIQKRKIVVGPNDSVGILLFNTSRKNNVIARGATEYKTGTYLYQPISQIDAPKIKELLQLLSEARSNHKWLRYEFPPSGDRVPMGDVFTSCNWAIRDMLSASKSGVKRVFLITDEDNPHLGVKNVQLVVSAKTTLEDLRQAGISMEPLFISSEERPFSPSKFYASILSPSEEEEEQLESDELLPSSISISRIEDLLEQMRFREIPKRALVSLKFELAEDFTIGVKMYGLITEQKKGLYKQFMDLGDRLEIVEPKTLYVDEGEQREIDKSDILYGMSITAPPEGNEEGEFSVRAVPPRSKVFYTAGEIRSFRKVGIKPGISLLGFKDSTELAVEDNVKHSMFIYPDEDAYSGSKRTFTALLKSMKKKDKIGIVLALFRVNSSPVICAMLPQEEKMDENGFLEPSGFHLIPYPFADDIRGAPIETGLRASDESTGAAKKWIEKLQIKGGYQPDAYPNPALAFHYAQLEAMAFHEEFDPSTFDDLTRPKIDMIHMRAGELMKEWKAAISREQFADTTFIQGAGTSKKRAADSSVLELEVRAKYDSGQLAKLTNDQLKVFLKSKSLSVSGKKAELVVRVVEWLERH